MGSTKKIGSPSRDAGKEAMWRRVSNEERWEGGEGDWRTDAQHDREARCIAFANPRHGWQYNTPLCKQQQHRWCCSCLATPSSPLHLSMRVCTGHTAWEHVLVPVCIRERVLVHRWGDTRAYERGTRGALRSTSTSRHLTLRSVRFSNHGGSIWMDEFRYLPSIQVSSIVPRYKRNERRGETSIVPSIVASFFLLFFFCINTLARTTSSRWKDWNGSMVRRRVEWNGSINSRECLLSSRGGTPPERRRERRKGIKTIDRELVPGRRFVRSSILQRLTVERRREKKKGEKFGKKEERKKREEKRRREEVDGQTTRFTKTQRSVWSRHQHQHHHHGGNFIFLFF